MPGAPEKIIDLSDDVDLEKTKIASEKASASEKAAEQEKTNSLVMGFVVVAAFMFFGPALIMTNKTILNSVGFPYPMTMTFYTSLFCTISMWSIVKLFPNNDKLKLEHADMITRDFYMKNIMPIGFFQGATIVCGMSSYLYLTVSFLQMLKASNPVMIVIFLRLFGIQSPTKQVIGSVCVICLGTALSGYGEINFDMIGVTLMLSAQVAEALRLVMTQKLLQNLKFNVVETLCYITPAATFWVFLAALVTEWPTFKTATLEVVRGNWQIFLVSGMLAVGVNGINSTVIKFTSSLMVKLLSTARAALLVVFNVMLMGESVTAIQGLGYAISLGGFFMYNHYRNKK